MTNIYFEESPNPNSLKFVINYLIIPEGETHDFPDVESASYSPLAQELFGFNYVKRVFIMNNLKYSSIDLYDGYCTAKQYYDQFDTARDLQVGKQYKNNVGCFMETIWEIVAIHDRVALAIEIKGPNTAVGINDNYCLFIKNGNMAGWKYNDNRASYRLRELN